MTIIDQLFMAESNLLIEWNAIYIEIEYGLVW